MDGQQVFHEFTTLPIDVQLNWESGGVINAGSSPTGSKIFFYVLDVITIGTETNQWSIFTKIHRGGKTAFQKDLN